MAMTYTVRPEEAELHGITAQPEVYRTIQAARMARFLAAHTTTNPQLVAYEGTYNNASGRSRITNLLIAYQ